jgi:hypothetical protein
LCSFSGQSAKTGERLIGCAGAFDTGFPQGADDVFVPVDLST